jgi:hypothetical protein
MAICPICNQEIMTERIESFLEDGIIWRKWCACVKAEHQLLSDIGREYDRAVTTRKRAVEAGRTEAE